MGVFCAIAFTEVATNTRPDLLKQAVRAGLGLGCISRAAVIANLESGMLKRVHAPWLDLRRTVSLVLHRHKYIEPELAAFVAYRERHASDVVE